jgi:hypothetical protein
MARLGYDGHDGFPRVIPVELLGDEHKPLTGR